MCVNGFAICRYPVHHRRESDTMGAQPATRSKGIVSRPEEERARERLLSLGPQGLTDAEHEETTEYGDTYRICGTLSGPNGRVLRVVSIWMTESATGTTKFITLYPERKK
jgi:hypothetical protein